MSTNTDNAYVQAADVAHSPEVKALSQALEGGASGFDLVWLAFIAMYVMQSNQIENQVKDLEEKLKEIEWLQKVQGKLKTAGSQNLRTIFSGEDAQGNTIKKLDGYTDPTSKEVIYEEYQIGENHRMRVYLRDDPSTEYVNEMTGQVWHSAYGNSPADIFGAAAGVFDVMDVLYQEYYQVKDGGSSGNYARDHFVNEQGNTVDLKHHYTPEEAIAAMETGELRYKSPDGTYRQFTAEEIAAAESMVDGVGDTIGGTANTSARSIRDAALADAITVGQNVYGTVANIDSFLGMNSTERQTQLNSWTVQPTADPDASITSSSYVYSAITAAANTGAPDSAAEWVTGAGTGGYVTDPLNSDGSSGVHIQITDNSGNALFSLVNLDDNLYLADPLVYDAEATDAERLEGYDSNDHGYQVGWEGFTKLEDQENLSINLESGVSLMLDIDDGILNSMGLVDSNTGVGSQIQFGSDLDPNDLVFSATMDAYQLEDYYYNNESTGLKHSDYSSDADGVDSDGFSDSTREQRYIEDTKAFETSEEYLRSIGFIDSDDDNELWDEFVGYVNDELGIELLDNGEMITQDSLDVISDQIGSEIDQLTSMNQIDMLYLQRDFNNLNLIVTALSNIESSKHRADTVVANNLS